MNLTDTWCAISIAIVAHIDQRKSAIPPPVPEVSPTEGNSGRQKRSIYTLGMGDNARLLFSVIAVFGRW